MSPKKPARLRHNPQDFDIELFLTEGDATEADMIHGKIGGSEVDWCLNALEAEKIGNWLLKFAKWSRAKEKTEREENE